ncbi:hypothetical protein AHAS_Ahas04G0155700 [Arachis hypogaea]
MAIKNELNDPHNVLENWDSNFVDPCRWRMITCNLDGSVSVLEMSSQNLSGTLSSWIGNLTNLQFITSKQTAEILKRKGKGLESQLDSLKAMIKDLQTEAILEWTLVATTRVAPITKPLFMGYGYALPPSHDPSIYAAAYVVYPIYGGHQQ